MVPKRELVKRERGWRWGWGGIFCKGIDSGIHLLLADRGRKRMGSLRSVWHGNREIEVWRLRRRHRDGKERSG